MDGACDFCGARGPVAWLEPYPVDDELACFGCRGLTELECGKHVIDTVTASCGGIHMPVATCGVCDGGTDGAETNHSHTREELDAFEREIDATLEAAGKLPAIDDGLVGGMEGGEAEPPPPAAEGNPTRA